MESTPTPIAAAQLSAHFGTANAPLIIDVRRTAQYEEDRVQVAGALRRVPEEVTQWLTALPVGRPIVVYCVHGRQVSQSVATQLSASGFEAYYLEGGINAWQAQNLPTRLRTAPASPQWVTRARPKIDRIACPWLILRFIDPQAEFLYVPGEQVQSIAAQTGATPFDIVGAEFGHVGEECSFDAFIRIFGIVDPALKQLATIIRGADTGHPELTPQSAGLSAISMGLSHNFSDDHDVLRHGLVIYDALYAWCRSCQAETHNWPPQS